MILLYILLIAYILAVNFYSFLLVKSLRDKERLVELEKLKNSPLSAVSETATDLNEPTAQPQNTTPTTQPEQRYTGKLCIAGLLGGAITIYVSMFLLKFRRSDLLLMILMPLLGVLNIYLWVLLFKSGFTFFVIR